MFLQYYYNFKFSVKFAVRITLNICNRLKSFFCSKKAQLEKSGFTMVFAFLNN